MDPLAFVIRLKYDQLQNLIPFYLLKLKAVQSSSYLFCVPASVA